VYTLAGPILSLEDMIDKDKVFFIVGVSVNFIDSNKYTCEGIKSIIFDNYMLVYFPSDNKFYIYSNTTIDGNVINLKIQEYDIWVKLSENKVILDKIFFDTLETIW
jgi:hypothetical protein